MDAFQWIDENLEPRRCETPGFIYDDMESQSGRCLPILYLPFDAGDRVHWGDRGATFDFLHATRAEGGRVLDLGPGDGWPSLNLAPFVGEVVGADGSARRVEVCEQNARRLGIENATFLHVEPGRPLPFPGGSFDAVTAASSVEQAPDPRATLSEIHRVLRPGGRFRIFYEALSRYVPGGEREIGTFGIDDATSALILYDRDVEGERAVQYRVDLPLSEEDLEEAIGGGSVTDVPVSLLEGWRDRIVDARVVETIHPSGATFSRWMREVGFTGVRPTHGGGRFAADLFDRTPAADRPRDLAGVDALLGPAVGAVVEREAPIEADPLITAVK